MRGLSILLMLFLNDMYLPEISEWTDFKASGSDGIGLADLVFPGFLFIAGMAIPLSIGRRISNGENNITIAKHIAVRSVSLLIIGLLMLNSERVNPEFTGIGKNLWTILMFAGVFLIWNKYQETDSNFFTIQGLRLIGMALLVALVFKFRSGEFENNGSLITGTWGILGLIGWGYLAAAFIYLAARDNIMNIVVAFFFFLTMNILTKLDLLTYLDPAKPVFGVIIEGYIPMIVISGTLTTMILKKYSPAATGKAIVTIVTIGVLSLIAGFLLHNYFIIKEIQAAPGWGIICIGLSMIIFALIYLIIDIRRYSRWTLFIKPAGENSLMTYLVATILYSLISLTGMPILIYKQSSYLLISVAGSILWSVLIIWIITLMTRFNIRLKI
jgi:predicted acyltransferase